MASSQINQCVNVPDKGSVCWLGTGPLMGSTQSRVGDAPSHTGFLSQLGSSGIDIGPLFNTVMSDLDSGLRCALMNFADDTKLKVNLQKGESPWTMG